MQLINKQILFDVMIWIELEDMITLTNTSKQLYIIINNIWDDNLIFKSKIEIYYNTVLSNREIDWQNVYWSFFRRCHFHSHLDPVEAMTFGVPELIDILIELFPNDKRLKQYMFQSCCNCEDIERLNKLINNADININGYCSNWKKYLITSKKTKTIKKLLTADKLDIEYRDIFNIYIKDK
jgi:hypothetical protein